MDEKAPKASAQELAAFGTDCNRNAEIALYKAEESEIDKAAMYFRAYSAGHLRGSHAVKMRLRALIRVGEIAKAHLELIGDHEMDTKLAKEALGEDTPEPGPYPELPPLDPGVKPLDGGR